LTTAPFRHLVAYFRTQQHCQRQVNEETIAAAIKQIDGANLVRARKKRAFQVYIETLRIALQAARCDESWLAC
jgi:hypothetical protein